MIAYCFRKGAFVRLDSMQIGFIGAGKAGVSLGKYFKEKGVSVGGYYSKSPESARWAADFTETTQYECLQDIISSCDLLLFTVPDGVIGEVWEQAMPYISGKIVGHCSGLHSSKIFSDTGKVKCRACSIHPLSAISSRESSYKELSGVLFTLEGEETVIPIIEKMFRNMGNRTRIISAENKIKYHAAAALASNYMTGLFSMAQSLFLECGFEEKEAERELYALSKGNLDHIRNQGCVDALTGPVERNDACTVKKHLDVLDPGMREVYRKNAQYLVTLAERKHPGRDYTAVREICGSMEGKQKEYAQTAGAEMRKL